MTDELKHETLDIAIDGAISNGGFSSAGDEELDALTRVALGLRGFPSADFKAQLGAELQSEATWASGSELSLPVLSWFNQHRAFAAAGASSGLVGGACCLAAVIASVFGIASAAAASSFIDSTMPFFIALSVVTLLMSLAMMLREQGITLDTVALTARRQGLAVAGAYTLVFGSSMALTMAMGLY